MLEGDALRDVSVLTLAVNVPGPVAAARLRSIGARVTKVEPPGGDPLAASAPAWYEALRAGQRVVTLDLASADGRTALDGLLSVADLLLTSQRPSALARLRLAWAHLHARFPRLCHVAIVGHAAPHQERAGHDLTYAASAGLIVPPGLPRTLVVDLGGAERAATTGVALLLARERGGEAGYVEVPLAAVARDVAAPLRAGLTAPDGILGGGFPGYALYRATDGWIALAALEPRFRERLLQLLSIPALERAALERVFAERSAEEWESWSRANDVPLAAVRPPSSGRTSATGRRGPRAAGRPPSS